MKERLLIHTNTIYYLLHSEYWSCVVDHAVDINLQNSDGMNYSIEYHFLHGMGGLVICHVYKCHKFLLLCIAIYDAYNIRWVHFYLICKLGCNNCGNKTQKSLQPPGWTVYNWVNCLNLFTCYEISAKTTFDNIYTSDRVMTIQYALKFILFSSCVWYGLYADQAKNHNMYSLRGRYFLPPPPPWGGGSFDAEGVLHCYGGNTCINGGILAWITSHNARH